MITLKSSLIIYGQGAPGDAVYIVGAPEALEVLRSALSAALAGAVEDYASAEFRMPLDGEGYSVVVLPMDGMGPGGHLAAPYFEEWAKDPRPDALWPGTIVKSIMDNKR